MTSSGVSVILYSPRIPQNLAAVGRVCAATRTPLHVIRPVPFPLDDKSIRRTGMDYWDLVDLAVHNSFAECRAACGDRRVWLFTTKATRAHTDAEYRAGDMLLFGNESHGVPDDIHAAVGIDCSVRIPILEPRARSLNLASSVAVAVYEAMRRLGVRESAPP